jgi:hypothetical protein
VGLCSSDTIRVAEMPPRRVNVRGRDTERTDLPMLFESTLPPLFWSKVVALPSGCWEWRGARTRGGYGTFRIGSRSDGSRRSSVSHRLAYESLVGLIPDGLTLDHLCVNPPCVRPHHLEPVTMRANILRGEGPAALNARQTKCIRGHPLTARSGQRYCRICNLARVLRSKALAS